MATQVAGSDAGVTLIEVLIASLLTLLILTMGYEILSTSSRTATAVNNRAHNSTEARITVDTLEANLRYANGVWLCAPVSSTPQTVSSASVSCPPYVSGVAALLVSNDTSLSSVASGTAACDEWIITTALSDPTAAAGLYEVKLGGVSGLSFPVTPLTNMPGVVAAANSTGTTGFSLALPGSTSATPPVVIAGRLVVADLTVNQDPTSSYKTGDSVLIHDSIAPDNLTTGDDTTAVPCS